ncbi:MAG: guanylate kinase [Candidatus Azobacteroides pseudotrichonymphae]|uniref:Guanylate kinase n=1 Tax=Azobacteroides pseudotrichonymphae genomovar. CFP2 TaxID=511995 RepID=B6YR43_AZOPC|nr:guanylate kinase [Candidatus Azobacteroides pseudotrichonymphae]MDR0529934.1 guanylate kinase [Bacteroidales bacterium OttesenSCG-928-I14]BAG83665.1 guanylate kinase [Candidatus Azobacteroides pseudotrichonymphae genomovar. CFP2]GMO32094.1 MAG: guanylate kinase [Candidatus Azobacteroides pseudotrichonymphae]
MLNQCVFPNENAEFKKLDSKLIIISAPSGSGKTTIVDSLLKEQLSLELAISATSRPAREGEKNGEEYYFLTMKEFERNIKANLFLEYEEVYPGRFYGTLKSEVDIRLRQKKNIILNLDTAGGINVKKIYGGNTLLIFLMPPSIEELKRRLEKRGTDSSEVIRNRLFKATYEISLATQYDMIILNDDLGKAKREFIQIISKFITGK